MSRRDQDSAAASAPTEPGVPGPPPEDVGDAGQAEVPAQRRPDLLETLDVVPTVAAGAALGAKRRE